MDIKKQVKITGDNLLPVYTSLLSPFIEQYPIFSTAVLTAYGFFGIGMEYKKSEMREYISHIKDNIGIFIPEIVESKEFKDGFVLITEAYIKERSEKKREYIKDILLDFTQLTKEEKDKSELEKILNVITLISGNGLELLSSVPERLLMSEYGMDVTSLRLHLKHVNANILEYVKELENLGIFLDVYEEKNDGTFGAYGGNLIRKTKMSNFGKAFISYILKDE